eukprot:608095_1
MTLSWFMRRMCRIFIYIFPIDPTIDPTESPTKLPTTAPFLASEYPSIDPTESPTKLPTTAPFLASEYPSIDPTESPTKLPTTAPFLASEYPSKYTTVSPTEDDIQFTTNKNDDDVNEEQDEPESKPLIESWIAVIAILAILAMMICFLIAVISCFYYKLKVQVVKDRDVVEVGAQNADARIPEPCVLDNNANDMNKCE